MNPERKIKTSAGEETSTQTADRINSIRAKANSPKPQVSEEGRAAAGRIAAARADNTITPESLAPQAEVQVTDPQTGTAMAGLGGALEAQTDSFAQGLTDTRKQREAEKNQSRNDYRSLVANRTGLEGFSLQADQDAGVFEADSALQDINNELRAEQLARRRSNELITSTGGQSKGQAQSQINNVNRESYSKQADMAIVQLAAQGRFNSASALADRKANAMFEQEQNQIDAAKITYEDNKDLYNKAEQREFETALTDRTNRVQAEKEQMRAVQKLAIDALNGGAPQSLVSEMMKSKTLADASALGGQFVGALDREEQRASINASNASASLKAEQLLQMQQPSVVTRPTEIVDINGVKSLVDTQTGETIQTFEAGTTTNEVEVARGTAFVNTIDALKTDSGLNSSVGPTFLTRTAGVDALSGAKDDFVASVENVVKTLTLNTFAEAKEKGMTFGAMSQGEWNILGDSATKISNFRVYEKEGIPGFRKTTDKVAGYDASEKDFLTELDSISNFAKMDAIRRGSKPEDIGVVVTEDGSHWTQNSDGTFTELEITPIQ